MPPCRSSCHSAAGTPQPPCVAQATAGVLTAGVIELPSTFLPPCKPCLQHRCQALSEGAYRDDPFIAEAAIWSPEPASTSLHQANGRRGKMVGIPIP